jgi:hypothetical protein
MKNLLFLITLVLSNANAFEPALKRSQLFETFGLFTESGQSGIFYQGKDKLWADLNARITFYESENFWGKPQFVFNADLDASLRFKSKEFYSDTQDVTTGVAGLFTLNPNTRLMIYFSHLSGHTLEDVEDRDLISKDVGDDSIKFRLIKDFEDKIRLGGSLRLTFNSIAGYKKITADQFLEWLPLGENLHSKTPFVAIGLEENGIAKYILTSHLQMGYYLGNHMNIVHDDVVKFSIGWYNGIDPRQKYAQYRQNQTHFGYAGLTYEY